jgi:ABC transporter substrate binding protein
MIVRGTGLPGQARHHPGMDRRRFLSTSLAGALVAPLGAEAQATRKTPRIGIVIAASPTSARHQVDAFREGLRELGYIDRQSIVIEERWAEGKPERFGDLIADLQRSPVDVIVVGSAAGARAAKNAVTTMTPVVFVAVTDPIGSGVVMSTALLGPAPDEKCPRCDLRDCLAQLDAVDLARLQVPVPPEPLTRRMGTRRDSGMSLGRAELH